jgi:far upstream element-binding protein
MIIAQTGAHCEVDKNAPHDAHEKSFIVRGSPDAVERAKSMILEKLGMPGGGGGYGYGGSGGYGYDNGGGGVSVNPGQPQDYSAQWAEYYRSMGMVKEAEAIEAQRVITTIRRYVFSFITWLLLQAQTQAAAAPQQPAANGQPDYSAQWAEYYRSIGKHAEADAIEKQIKQKVAVKFSF